MGRRIWVLVLLLSLVTAVNAEGAISFGSGVEGIVFAADGATPMDHLFGSYLAITPGERLEEGLCVRAAKDTRLYLHCTGAGGELKAMRLQIEGEKTLFDGTLEQAGWINLGTFSPGEPEMLNLYLTVPEDLTPQGTREWQNISWQLDTQPAPLPKTGDNVHIPAAIFTGSLMGLCLAIAAGKKKPSRRGSPCCVDTRENVGRG